MNIKTQHHDIGKTIAARLAPIIGPGKVFALRADPETPLPLATYRRTAYEAEEDKDHRYTERVSQSIAILTSDYAQGISLAQDALKALHDLQGLSVIERITLDNSLEDTEEEGNIYVQILELTFHTYY